MKIRSLAVTMVALVLAAGAAQAQDVAGDAARADARAVAESFGRALAAGDSLAALALLHDDVTIYESGHAETRAQYRSGHLRSDIAFASAVPRTTTAADVFLSGDVALYTSEYTAKGRFRDRDIDSHGTESMLLVRTPDGWKIRHIHWSAGR